MEREEIIVVQTHSTPSIRYKNGELVIEGKMISIQISEFFQPLMKKIIKWYSDSQPLYSVTFSLRYINSAGKRVIIELCHNLKKFDQNGVLKEVFWKYEADDEYLKEFGEDLREMTGLPLRILEI